MLKILIVILTVAVMVAWATRARRHFETFAVGLLICVLLMLFVGEAGAQTIPRECLKYRRDLVRNARQIWGMDAPIATLAAQMRQESGCRPDAKSKFASGLTQFTPPTATWISRIFPDLAGADTLNPVWAIRAQSHYDKMLFDRAGGATECDSAWFTLWSYNGGEGWVKRDKRLAAASGADPRKHVEVEPFNAGRAPAMFRENRDYPKKIILRWQPMFIEAGWGDGWCA